MSYRVEYRHGSIHPLRLDMEVVGEFRNTSTHFVTDEYELFYGPILQECVKYYEEKLRELHGIEIRNRIPKNYLALSTPVELLLPRSQP